MRLRIVYPHVDLICINENAVTYTGIEREMQFEKYKERLTIHGQDCSPCH